MRAVPVRRGALVAATLVLASSASAATTNACAAPRDVPPSVALPAVDASTAKSCAITARDVAGARLFDARRGSGLREALPGSVMFDATAAPPFGPRERAVLVGDSDDIRRLLAQCARLHAEGYGNVRVLAGGFEAWRRAMKIADEPRRRFATPLTAAALEYRAAVARHVLVFDAAADAALHRLGVPANVERRDEVPAAAARRIAADLTRRRVEPGLDPITVVLADRRGLDAWRDAWNATAYPDPQFYVGDDAQFRADIARGERIAAERGKPLPGPCER